MGQQRIGRDVEGYAQKRVGRTLIELAAEPAIGDIELEQAVAGWQRHLVHFRRIPGRNDMPTAIGLGFDGLDQVGDLVDLAPIRRWPAAPLAAIDRAEISIVVRPFVPDLDAALLQPAHICLATYEPQQLINDGLEMQLLGRQQRKALRKIEAHLVAEERARAGTGAVRLVGAGFENIGEEFQIGLHGGQD